MSETKIDTDPYAWGEELDEDLDLDEPVEKAQIKDLGGPVVGTPAETVIPGGKLEKQIRETLETKTERFEKIMKKIEADRKSRPKDYEPIMEQRINGHAVGTQQPVEIELLVFYNEIYGKKGLEELTKNVERYMKKTLLLGLAPEKNAEHNPYDALRVSAQGKWHYANLTDAEHPKAEAKAEIEIDVPNDVIWNTVVAALETPVTAYTSASATAGLDLEPSEPLALKPSEPETLVIGQDAARISRAYADFVIAAPLAPLVRNSREMREAHEVREAQPLVRRATPNPVLVPVSTLEAAFAGAPATETRRMTLHREEEEERERERERSTKEYAAIAVLDSDGKAHIIHAVERSRNGKWTTVKHIKPSTYARIQRNVTKSPHRLTYTNADTMLQKFIAEYKN